MPCFKRQSTKYVRFLITGVWCYSKFSLAFALSLWRQGVIPKNERAVCAKYSIQDEDRSQKSPKSCSRWSPGHDSGNSPEHLRIATEMVKLQKIVQFQPCG